MRWFIPDNSWLLLRLIFIYYTPRKGKMEESSPKGSSVFSMCAKGVFKGSFSFFLRNCIMNCCSYKSVKPTTIYAILCYTKNLAQHLNKHRGDISAKMKQNIFTVLI